MRSHIELPSKMSAGQEPVPPYFWAPKPPIVKSDDWIEKPSSAESNKHLRRSTRQKIDRVKVS